MLVGGIMYCLPILKTEEYRKALLEAVRVCDRVFLGTDSTPHAIGNKENSCGCAEPEAPRSTVRAPPPRHGRAKYSRSIVRDVRQLCASA